MAADAPDKAKEFMKAVQAHHDAKSQEDAPSGFSKVLEAKRALQTAMQHLDAHVKGKKS